MPQSLVTQGQTFHEVLGLPKTGRFSDQRALVLRSLHDFFSFSGPIAAIEQYNLDVRVFTDARLLGRPDSQLPGVAFNQNTDGHWKFIIRTQDNEFWWWAMPERNFVTVIINTDLCVVTQISSKTHSELKFLRGFAITQVAGT